MNKRKMSEVETGVVAQALYKFLADKVATNTPGNLRAAVDDHYRELFETTGAKSFEVRIGEDKVGTYSVRLTKPEKKRYLKVAEPDAFMAWCADNGCIITEPDISKATSMFDETGELPDGCSVVTLDEAGGKWNGGTLKVDPEKVNNVLGGSVIPVSLLEGDDS